MVKHNHLWKLGNIGDTKTENPGVQPPSGNGKPDSQPPNQANTANLPKVDIEVLNHHINLTHLQSHTLKTLTIRTNDEERGVGSLGESLTNLHAGLKDLSSLLANQSQKQRPDHAYASLNDVINRLDQSIRSARNSIAQLESIWNKELERIQGTPKLSSQLENNIAKVKEVKDHINRVESLVSVYLPRNLPKADTASNVATNHPPAGVTTSPPPSDASAVQPASGASVTQPTTFKVVGQPSIHLNTEEIANQLMSTMQGNEIPVIKKQKLLRKIEEEISILNNSIIEQMRTKSEIDADTISRYLMFHILHKNIVNSPNPDQLDTSWITQQIQNFTGEDLILSRDELREAFNNLKQELPAHLRQAHIPERTLMERFETLNPIQKWALMLGIPLAIATLVSYAFDAPDIIKMLTMAGTALAAVAYWKPELVMYVAHKLGLDIPLGPQTTPRRPRNMPEQQRSTPGQQQPTEEPKQPGEKGPSEQAGKPQGQRGSFGRRGRDGEKTQDPIAAIKENSKYQQLKNTILVALRDDPELSGRRDEIRNIFEIPREAQLASPPFGSEIPTDESLMLLRAIIQQTLDKTKNAPNRRDAFINQLVAELDRLSLVMKIKSPEFAQQWSALSDENKRRLIIELFKSLFVTPEK